MEGSAYPRTSVESEDEGVAVGSRSAASLKLDPVCLCAFPSARVREIRVSVGELGEWASLGTPDLIAEPVPGHLGVRQDFLGRREYRQAWGLKSRAQELCLPRGTSDTDRRRGRPVGRTCQIARSVHRDLVRGRPPIHDVAQLKVRSRPALEFRNSSGRFDRLSDHVTLRSKSQSTPPSSTVRAIRSKAA
jgi:hypothetical protein